MLTNKERNTLSGAFAGHTPSVTLSACLNARHKDADCVLCVSTCPADAITLTAGRPQLDTGHCVACGVCEAVCPTDLFSQTAPPEPKLVRTATQLGARSIAVVCPLHQTPGHTAAPVEAIVRHKRCLAAITAPDLLALSSNGLCAVWLDDTPCADCAIGTAHSEIASAEAMSNALLRSAGQSVAIHLVSEQKDPRLAKQHEVQVFDGAQPKLSRRGLFGALRQATANKLDAAADQTAAALQSAGRIPADEPLTQRIPPSRMRLLHQLLMLPIPTKPASLPQQAPFAEVVIDNQLCSACELCAHFCPTGALQFSQTGETYDIGFRVSACIRCDICVVACPDNAVTLGSLTEPARLLTDERRSLAHGMLAACGLCAVPTAVREIDETRILCYACRGAAGAWPRQEEADLIDDLFKRLPGGEQRIV